MTTNSMLADFIKVQQEIDGLGKNATNPHFRNSYLNLEGLLKAAVPVLNKNNFALTQIVDTSEGRDTPDLITRLLHTSGEFVESRYPLLAVDPRNPQQLGSATTYSRRYSLQAILGVTGEDDDGNAASGLSREANSSPAPSSTRSASFKAPSEKQIELAKKLMKEVRGVKSYDEANAIAQELAGKAFDNLSGYEMSKKIIDALKDEQGGGSTPGAVNPADEAPF